MGKFVSTGFWGHWILILSPSTIDKMFEIFGPIFEQNANINFEPIFEKSVNFGPIFEKNANFGRIFEKKCKFRTFCQWQMTSLLGCISAPHKKQD